MLEEHPELFWKESDTVFHQVGGFSRISQIVNEIRRQQESVLFIDCGDLFHGTAPLVMSKGEAVIPVMNQLGVDAFVPGNWDFAYGRERLQELAGKLNAPTLAANVKDAETAKPLFSPHTVKELQGVKVGIIGLTYPYVDQTMPPAFSKGLSFSLGVEELPEHIASLKRENVDVIMLVSHMGLPLDVKLASLVDGIDVILSGHSHDRLTQPIFTNGTAIIQSGASGSFLGKIELEIDAQKITNIKHALLPMYADLFTIDPEMDQIVQQTLAPYKEQLAEVVGRVETPLHRMTLNEAPMDRFITDAYLQAVDADVAFSHGWRYGAPITPGPLTMEHLHQIIPTNPELFVMEVEGATLLNALEKNLEQVFAPDPFDQKGGYILRASGLFMAFKPYNPAGNRIQHLEIGGQLFDSGKSYRVAGAGEQLFKGIKAERVKQNIKAVDVLKQVAQSRAVSIDNIPRVLSI